MTTGKTTKDRTTRVKKDSKDRTKSRRGTNSTGKEKKGEQKGKTQKSGLRTGRAEQWLNKDDNTGRDRRAEWKDTTGVDK